MAEALRTTERLGGQALTVPAATVADGVIAGFGGLGYELAVEAAARLVEEGKA